MRAIHRMEFFSVVRRRRLNIYGGGLFVLAWMVNTHFCFGFHANTRCERSTRASFTQRLTFYVQISHPQLITTARIFLPEINESQKIFRKRKQWKSIPFLSARSLAKDWSPPKVWSIRAKKRLVHRTFQFTLLRTDGSLSPGPRANTCAILNSSHLWISCFCFASSPRAKQIPNLSFFLVQTKLVRILFRASFP